MKIKWYFVVCFIVIVCVTTLFVRIPIASRGYFNVGDIAVVFAGLVLTRRYSWLAGGLGSALADIISGFAIFAPLTFIAKGLEGFFSGWAGEYKGFSRYIFLVIAVSMLVVVYFLGELIMPQIGYAGALAELPTNLIQAAGGLIGGRILFALYEKMKVLL